MPAENAQEHGFGLKSTKLILWGTKKGNGKVTREARPCIRKFPGGISKGYRARKVLGLVSRQSPAVAI
jgi:hypothetical protein